MKIRDAGFGLFALGLVSIAAFWQAPPQRSEVARLADARPSHEGGVARPGAPVPELLAGAARRSDRPPAVAGRARAPAAEPSATVPIDPLTIAGYVVDRATRQPVAGADVSLGKRGGATTCDATGYYELIVERLDAVLLVARAPGYRSVQTTLPPSDTHEPEVRVDLYLLPAPRLEVRVLGATTGQPVAGAELAFAAGTGGFLPSLEQLDQVSLEPLGTTDAAGRFEGAVPDTAGWLQVRSAGHASRKVPVELAVGRGRGSVLVRLTPAARIQGRVVDPTAAPVVSATVHLFAKDGVRLETITASDGTYRFDALDGECTAQLVVLHDEFVPWTAGRFWLPAGTSVQRPDIVLTRAGSLAGTVRSARGKPLAGMPVRALLQTEPAGDARALPGTSSAVPGASVLASVLGSGTEPEELGHLLERPLEGVTLADGSFELHSLEPGTYSLSVELDRRTLARLDAVRVLPGERTSGLELVVEGDSYIRGRVLSGGAPVAGVRLKAVPLREQNKFLLFIALKKMFLSVADGVVESGPDGTFELGPLEPGPHLVVLHAGASRIEYHSVEAPAEQVDLDWQVRRRLRGAVRDAETGAALHEFHLALDVSEPPYPRPSFPYASADGTFELPTDDAGPLELRVGARGYSWTTIPIAAAAEPAGSAFVEADLVPVRSISGRVFCHDGVPLAGASVRAAFGTLSCSSHPEVAVEHVTAADGSFEFDCAARLSSFVLLVAHPDHAPARLLVERETTDSAALEVRLEAGHTLRGLVRHRDSGAPLAGMLVQTGTQSATLTDTSGRFELRHVPTGQHWIAASNHQEELGVSSSLQLDVEHDLDGLELRFPPEPVRYTRGRRISTSGPKPFDYNSVLGGGSERTTP